MVTRESVCWNVFLSTVTMVTVPGLSSTSIVPLTGTAREVRAKVGPNAGVAPAPPNSSSRNRLIPQPIWYPVSNTPPASLPLPLPVTEPVNVPPTRYSREDSAVVSGGTGSWVSPFADTVNVQPSGLVTTPGSADATAPCAGGGPVLTTGITGGSALGSAAASGDVSAEANKQMAARAVKRFNMCVGAFRSQIPQEMFRSTTRTTHPKDGLDQQITTERRQSFTELGPLSAVDPASSVPARRASAYLAAAPFRAAVRRADLVNVGRALSR